MKPTLTQCEKTTRPPRMLRWALPLALLSAVGCSPSREGDADYMGTPNQPGGGGGGGGGPVDVPPQECKKVDILFVVDNSGSMADNQLSLIRSFPGFVNGMRTKLSKAQDYQVGVVTSDDYYSNAPGCSGIGSLVTKTGGPKSSNKTCGPYFGGKRFMQSADPDLGDRFACAAQVGAGGNDDERMAKAMLSALSPKLTGPGGCNEGFSRKDALLVVVMITDEDDVQDGCDGDRCMSYGSGGTPDEWFTEFSKYRKAENTVMLSLLGTKGGNPCGAVPASRLMRLTNKFGKNGYLGDICAGSYDQFFEQALPVINQACRVFLPPA